MANEYFSEFVNGRFGYFYDVHERIHAEHTGFQHLEVRRSGELGRVMLLDGITQVAERNDWLYHEPMVHPALCAHPDPRRVCIVGAGDGGIAREVLRHGPERVVQCELDRRVVEVCREHLPTIGAGAFDDPRVELAIGDGRRFIETTDERFDTVIMDMTDPFGPSALLYTQEMFAAVKTALCDEHGLFVMHCESPIARPTAFQQILRTLATVWPHQAVFYVYIQMYGVLWAIVVSGQSDAVATLPEATIATRLAARGIDGLQVYSPQTHRAMQVAYPFVTRLRDEAEQVAVITDTAHRFADEDQLEGLPQAPPVARKQQP
ncbi:MAG: polyamine aminopropyltransferase [Planctomycetota bacterium]